MFVLIEFERECDQKRPLQQFRKHETLVVGVVNARDNTVLGVDDTRPTRSRDRNRPMMYALALAAALTSAPAQGGDLKLTNVPMTIGELGPARPSAKLLPGDILFIGYDITGLSIEPDGLAKYKMSMEVSDAAGKSIFKQDPRELNDFIPLRGNSIPARGVHHHRPGSGPGQLLVQGLCRGPEDQGEGYAHGEVRGTEAGVWGRRRVHDL